MYLDSEINKRRLDRAKSITGKYQKFQKKKGGKIKKKKGKIPIKYHDYIKSQFWRERKNKYFQKFGRKCIICKSSKWVNVHHVVYGDYGSEKDEDLVVFCRSHHEQFHSIYGVKKDMKAETLEFITDECVREKGNAN